MYAKKRCKKGAKLRPSKAGHREIPIDFNFAVMVLYCLLKRQPALGIGKIPDWFHMDTEKQEILL
jgi:hypothetical protein